MGLGLGEGSKLRETLRLREDSGTSHLVGGFYWPVRSIVTEQRAEVRRKRKDLFCLPNGLAETLDKSFWNCKNKLTS